ncbi:MAG TPA: ATP-binding cassette domain-containing protein [Methanoregulaceae archaeon]|nr:ATP-binding cassette domain-containing protein [Methanoregulaceae archaeon]
MKVVLDQVLCRRERFVLRADARLGEGLHLVSGPVGSGKSTIALLLGGGLSPTEGRIDLIGIRRRLLIQQFAEFHLTGRTVLEEVASWGLDPSMLPDLAGPGVDAASDPFRLSRGEQKRLVLGCALATTPDLLVLDEPFASCDLRAKRRIGRLLTDRPGLTVVLTHDTRYLPAPDHAWTIDGGVLRSAAVAGRT